jgi:uncharacterized peroxidase-related enzyme
MTDTTTAGEILVQDTLGRVRTLPQESEDAEIAEDRSGASTEAWRTEDGPSANRSPRRPRDQTAGDFPFAVRNRVRSAIAAPMKFSLHTQASAPAASKPLLAQVESTFGFVPNLTAMLAESPAALAGYLQLSKIVQDNSALSPREQQVVMLAVSEANSCDYCMAAHSLIAGMAGLSEATVAALRTGGDLPDAKETALAKFARAVVEQRGWVSEAEQEAFLADGFTRQQVLDIIAIVALKTLSNYANHLAHTPLDPAFEEHRWTKSR